MTKQELTQIYWLNKEVVMWQQKLERLESQSLIKGQQITGMPSGGSRTTSKVEERAIRLEEIKERIQAMKDKAERDQVKLLQYIEGLEDVFVRQIIIYRYMELLPWKTVARRMGEGITADGVRKAVNRFLKKGE